MTLAISVLSNIFPLHTMTQRYLLKYPRVPRGNVIMMYKNNLLIEVTCVDELCYIGN